MLRQPPVRSRSAPVPAASAELDDRFIKLSAQFEVLKAQVRQAQQLSSLGTAAAMIAHEVNNMLTPIQGYADYALKSGDVELMKKALNVAASSARMLVAMSERVLELGAAKPQRRESVPVRRAVEDSLASLCRNLSKDGIETSITIDGSLAVWVDPLQLRQVLFNILLNAREAMAPTHSGLLTITASRAASQAGEGEHFSADEEGAEGTAKSCTDLSELLPGTGGARDSVTIEIRNTGKPIPPELLPHIFEPFQTGKPVERNGKARCGGLGLALCRDLVEENGGSISVRSDSTGTTFTMLLPASAEPV